MHAAVHRGKVLCPSSSFNVHNTVEPTCRSSILNPPFLLPHGAEIEDPNRTPPPPNPNTVPTIPRPSIQHDKLTTPSPSSPPQTITNLRTRWCTALALQQHPSPTSRRPAQSNPIASPRPFRCSAFFFPGRTSRSRRPHPRVFYRGLLRRKTGGSWGAGAAPQEQRRRLGVREKTAGPRG